MVVIVVAGVCCLSLLFVVVVVEQLQSVYTRLKTTLSRENYEPRYA